MEKMANGENLKNWIQDLVYTAHETPSFIYEI